MLLGRSDKKIFLISGVLLVLAIIAGWASLVASSAKKAGTVELSVGKIVYIGEAKTTLENDLKANLQPNGSNYNYTGSSGKIEGVIFMSGDTVRAISLTLNSHNRHKATQISIATSAASIDSAGVKNLHKLAAGQNLSGYKYSLSSVAGYFLIDPCNPNQKIMTIIMAHAGSEGLALPKVNKVEPCGSNDGGE